MAGGFFVGMLPPPTTAEVDRRRVMSLRRFTPLLYECEDKGKEEEALLLLELLLVLLVVASEEVGGLGGRPLLLLLGVDEGPVDDMVVMDCVCVCHVWLRPLVERRVFHEINSREPVSLKSRCQSSIVAVAVWKVFHSNRTPLGMLRCVLGSCGCDKCQFNSLLLLVRQVFASCLLQFGSFGCWTFLLCCCQWSFFFVCLGNVDWSRTVDGIL